MNKKGFSLIEMLTVIVVLLLMMGMMVRLFPNINRATEKAKTVEALQKTAYAINEFYAEYGTYPPVSKVAFVLEDSEATDKMFPASAGAYSGAAAPPPDRTYGLLAYLIPCPMGGVDEEYFGKMTEDVGWLEDSDADKAAKRKWAPFLEGVVHSGSSSNSQEIGGFDVPFITQFRTIRDGWDNEIHYVSKAPYTSYKLWSNGPDEENNTEDDMHVDQME